MSNEVVTLAQKRVVGSATKKAVLVYLADRASDDGSGIWTSKTHIAADTELSKRSVQTAMIEFERDGILKKVGTKKCQNGFTYEYELVLEAIKSLPSTRKSEAKETGAGDSPVQEVHLTGAGDSPHGVQEIHPNHPLTTHEPSNAQEREADLFSEKSKRDPILEVLSEILSEDVALDFIAHRKEKKAKLTERSAKMIVKSLRGHPSPDAVVEKSIMNGWQGVFPDRVQGQAQADPSSRYQKIAQEWGRG